MSAPRSPQDIAGLAGQTLGLSKWVLLDQSRINAFADVTEDHQFIHIDPARAAAETPFGGAVAHGFLTLSMLSTLAYDALPDVDGASSSVNYGFDRLRFISPVPAGSRIRARFDLDRADHTPAHLTLHKDVTIEIEGATKPALVARWITRHILG